jgi:hypothetical protein
MWLTFAKMLLGLWSELALIENKALAVGVCARRLGIELGYRVKSGDESPHSKAVLANTIAWELLPVKGGNGSEPERRRLWGLALV